MQTHKQDIRLSKRKKWKINPSLSHSRRPPRNSYHRSPLITSCNIGRPLNTPSLTVRAGGVFAFFGGVPTPSPSPHGLGSSPARFAPRLPTTPISGGSNVGCIFSAPSANANIHRRSSINCRNSANNGVAPSVLREPMMINLDWARVNDTLTRRQSFNRSPTWEGGYVMHDGDEGREGHSVPVHDRSIGPSR